MSGTAETFFTENGIDFITCMRFTVAKYQQHDQREYNRRNFLEEELNKTNEGLNCYVDEYIGKIPIGTSTKRLQLGLEGSYFGIGRPQCINNLWDVKLLELDRNLNETESELYCNIERYIVRGLDPNQNADIVRLTKGEFGFQPLQRGSTIMCKQKIRAWSLQEADRIMVVMPSEDFPKPDTQIDDATHCFVLDDSLWLFTIFPNRVEENVYNWNRVLGSNPGSREDNKNFIPKWPRLHAVRKMKFLTYNPHKAPDEKPCVKVVLSTPLLKTKTLFDKWFMSLC